MHELDPKSDLNNLAMSDKAAPLYEAVKRHIADNVEPITEEFFARGFLYRGWSESFLRVPGAIILSSLVWTGLHLQYNWYFLGEVFSIGLLLGYLRYRSNSTWLTIILHGLINLAAVVQTILLTSS